MTDEWKGEHLIPVGKLSESARRSTNMQVVSSVIAERNRRAGIKPHARSEHDRFVTRVFGTFHQILKIEAAAKRD